MYNQVKAKARIFSLNFVAGIVCLQFLSSANALQSAEQKSAEQKSAEQITAYECTQVALEDIDPALLTKQERIALLDGSLQESIDSYSTCVSSVQQNMGNGEGIGGNGNEGNEGAINGINNGADGNAPTNATNEGNQGTPNSEATELLELEKQPSKITPAAREVIAPKDNDKIICKLLFQEIQKVEDPDMLAGLKEQYSNYKCG